MLDSGVRQNDEAPHFFELVKIAEARKIEKWRNVEPSRQGRLFSCVDASFV
jgi:hypothetical protein